MIRAQNLIKHYRVHSRPPGLMAAMRSVIWRTQRQVRAVDDISFTLQPGQRVGFLGPNGAGKTTTLKMLSGLLVPTGGTANVGGFTPHERRREFLRSIMLVTGQKNQLIWDLPPADTFELNRAVYDVPKREFQQRLAELADLLGIGTVMHRPARQLSLGERMKCEITAALVHQPRVLFLDEPTIGLDVTMQSTVRRFLRTYCDRHGATLLLTSHNMTDVADICDRVLIIDHGKLRFDGSLPELVRRTRPEKRLTLQLSRPVGAAELESLGQIVSQDGVKAVLQVPQAGLRQSIERALRELPVVDLTAADAPLEEILRDLFAPEHCWEALP